MGVGFGVALGVGLGVGFGVGFGLGFGVELGVGVAKGVGVGVGDGVGRAKEISEGGSGVGFSWGLFSRRGIGDGCDLIWRGSSSSKGDLITGADVVSWGEENEPVSIQVSWPEGFLIGLLKNQRSPPITVTWIRATTMRALRKRGSCLLMVGLLA